MASLANRVISIHDRKTSMRLAPAEWEAIDTICKREHIKRNDLLDLISRRKDQKLGLTCSVRLFALIYFYHLLIDKKYSYSSKSPQIDSPVFDAITGIL